MCNPAHEVASTGAKGSLPRAQSRVRLRMPDREQLEFQRQQHQPAIFRKLRIMFAQGAQALRGSVLSREHCGDIGDPPADPLLEERKENIFLALEIGVKGPARVARLRGNVFQARSLKPVACERFFRRCEKLRAGRLSARPLPRNCRRGSPASYFLSEQARAVHRNGSSLPALQDTYMHVYY